MSDEDEIQRLKSVLHGELSAFAEAQQQACTEGVRLTVIALPRHGHATTAVSIDRFYQTIGIDAVFVYLDILGPASVRDYLAARQAATPRFHVLPIDRFVSRQMARLLVLDRTRTPYTLFIDNNMLFADGCVDELLCTAEETGADVVSPVIVMQGGNMHFSGSRIIEVAEDWFEYRQTTEESPSGVPLEACRPTRQEIDFAESHCCLFRTSAFAGRAAELFPLAMHNARNLTAASLLYRRSNPGGLMLVEPRAVASVVPIAFGYDLPWLFESYNRWEYYRQSYTLHSTFFRSAASILENLRWHRKHFLYLLDTLLRDERLDRADYLDATEVPAHVDGYDLPLPTGIEDRIESALVPWLCTHHPEYLDPLYSWIHEIEEVIANMDAWAARDGRGRDIVPIRLATGAIQWRDGEGELVTNRPLKRTFRLNPQACAIWQLCNGRSSEASIENRLARQFPESAASIVADVPILLRDLEERGLLALRAPAVAARPPSLDELGIVVINRRENRERRERGKQQLDAAGLAHRFFPAVWKDQLPADAFDRFVTEAGRALYREHGEIPVRGSLNRGSLAAALSWRAVIRGLYRNGPPVLVLEDDFLLCDEYRTRMEHSLSRIPEDFHLVYVGWTPHHWVNSEPVNPSVERLTGRVHGLGAVILNPTAKDLLLSIFPLTLQIDHDIPDRLIRTGNLNAYKLTFHGERLINNDNLGGSSTQT